MQEWNLPKRDNKDKKVLYINAHIIDPETKTELKGASLLTIGDKIADFGPKVEAKADVEIVDCDNKLLAPGLLDIQVHFREPGFTHKETIGSGSKSAVAGGITYVVCQPNTNPVIDSTMTLEWIANKAKETAYCNVHCYGAISKGMKGEELTDMGKMVEAGAVGFTDDGLPVMNAQLMRRALEYSKMFNVPIAQHAEDLNLSQKGCINEGPVSFKLGVTGIPNISESVIVDRDIQIVDYVGGRYHVLHVSTKEAIESVKRAKSKGLNVTCEVAPHHFSLTDEAVLGFNTNAKMNPPLRSKEDRLALIEAICDGTVDAIATDHAPHDPESKALPLAAATFGIVGLETMLPISLELYHQGKIGLLDLFALMTYKPANIVNSDRGRIKKGGVADLTLIDLNHEWVIDVEQFASKSKNSPYQGRKVKGRAIRTILAGETVYQKFM